MESASLDVPVLLFSNPADAGPAILFHFGEVFEAIEVHGHISSLLPGCLLADGFGLVDVIDAPHLEVMGAVVVDLVGHGEGQEGQHHQQVFHHVVVIDILLYPY